MDGYCIIVKGKQIQAVLPQSQIGRLPGYQVIDADGAYVSAGFIELYTHGIEGYDLVPSSILRKLVCSLGKTESSSYEIRLIRADCI